MTSARFLADLRSNLIRGDQALEQRLKLDQWVYQPGLPDNAARPDPQAFAAVDAALKRFNGGGAASAVPYKSWNTAERLRFLDGISRKMSKPRLAELDRAFELSESNNAETLFAWLQLAIANRYEPVAHGAGDVGPSDRDPHLCSDTADLPFGDHQLGRQGARAKVS
jgi:hypothetical protein